MPPGSRTYRLAAPVLVPALALLLAMGGPTLLHLCTLDGAAPVERADVPPCHEEAPTPETPEVQACCLTVAAVPTDGAVVAAPSERAPAPTVAAVAPPFAEAGAPALAPRPRDTGPPPLPVRSHLAFAVLLI